MCVYFSSIYNQQATETDSEIALNYAPLPTLALAGHGFERIVVTAGGSVLFSGPRKDAVDAFCLLMSSYYIFNLSYDEDKKGNATKKETRNLMDFLFM